MSDYVRSANVDDAKTVFFAVLRAINAALTYIFAATYFAPSLDGVIADPSLRGIVAGIAFVILLDAAALAWDSIYRFGATSTEQRAIARSMSLWSLAGSGVVSFVQLVFMQRLVDLSALYFGASVISVFGIAAIAVAHFIQTIRFNGASPELQEREEIARQEANLSRLALRRLAEKLDQDAAFVAERISEERRRSALAGLGVGDLLDAPGVLRELPRMSASAPPAPAIRAGREADETSPKD